MVTDRIVNATFEYEKEYYYEYQPIMPKVVAKYNGRILEEGIDYEVVYMNNDDFGTAYVRLIGLGCFTDKRTLPFSLLPEEFSINYVLEGGENSDKNPSHYYINSNDIVLEKPSKRGYVFEGWFSDEELTTAVEMIPSRSKGNITLFAKWRLNEYKITYELDGGTNSSNNPSSYTLQSYIIFERPTRDNYDFIGWYTSPEFGNEIKEIAVNTVGDQLLFARWKKHEHTYITLPRVLSTCTETGLTEGKICSDCGYVLVAQNVVEATGHTIVVDKAVAPTINSSGWTEGKHCSKCGLVTVKQKEIIKPVISTTWHFADVYTGSWYETAVEYCFAKDYINGTSINTFEPNSMLTRGMMVTILWNIAGRPNATRITRYSDISNTNAYYYKAVQWASQVKVVSGFADGSFGPGMKITREQLACMIQNFSKYQSVSNNKAADLTNFSDASIISSYAVGAVKWAVANKVISGKNGGKDVDPKGFASRAEAAAMIKNYCLNLVGLDEFIVVKKIPIPFTITYQLNGGKNTGINQTEYTVNTPSFEFLPLVKSNYSFAGWYKESNFKTRITGITRGVSGNITVYAKWVPVDYYITYQLDGGKNATNNPKVYTIESSVTFVAPQKSGYVFEGWYKESTFKTRVYGITKGSSGNLLLYAKWKPMTYTISYQLNGGTNAKTNPTTYSIQTATFLFAEPQKNGYTFDGWYKDASFTTKITGVSKGTMGNITLYAKWKSVTVPSTPSVTPTPTPGNDGGPLVWIPTNGGHKYHSRRNCSSMINPIQVTRGYAISQGFGACGRCY